MEGYRMMHTRSPADRRRREHLTARSKSIVYNGVEEDTVSPFIDPSHNIAYFDKHI